MCKLRFVRKQPSFAPKLTGITHEAAVVTDHPMARDDDRDRVAAIRRSGRSDAFGIAKLLGECQIRDGLPIRDLLQLPPDAFAEIGIVKIQGHPELPQ